MRRTWCRDLDFNDPPFKPICTLLFVPYYRMVTELESQLDYERIRREKLEAQLDEYRREIAYLSQELERSGRHTGVRNKCVHEVKISLASWPHDFVWFLALLDYVRRAHEIEICPSSVRVTIIYEPSARISSKFWLLLPLGHTLNRFLSSWNFDFLQIFFIFFNMRPYGSRNFKTLLLLQIATKSCQTFTKFSSQRSSQNYVYYFWNMKL